MKNVTFLILFFTLFCCGPDHKGEKSIQSDTMEISGEEEPPVQVYSLCPDTVFQIEESKKDKIKGRGEVLNFYVSLYELRERIKCFADENLKIASNSAEKRSVEQAYNKVLGKYNNLVEFCRVSLSITVRFKIKDANQRIEELNNEIVNYNNFSTAFFRNHQQFASEHKAVVDAHPITLITKAVSDLFFDFLDKRKETMKELAAEFNNLKLEKFNGR